MNSRTKAVLVITDVTDHGLSLTAALDKRMGADTTDRALVSELSYGVLRWHSYLLKILSAILKKPFKSKDCDIQNLLLMGLYQLLYMRVPDHAAINESVKVTLELKKSWAKSVVNGVLRTYQRNASTFTQTADCDPEAHYSHPSWILDRLKQDWPQRWETITAQNNRHAPMVLRVNCLKIERDAYLEQLGQLGMVAQSLIHCDYGIALEKAVDVSQLPGFELGWVTVQDGAAQLAASLLAAAPGERVLDVCAAPGGKTTHILESTPALKELVAVDIDDSRLSRVRENLLRLNLSATLVNGDALHPENWWHGEAFDRILLDVPCSASGVIRRHPDIKVLRKASDIKQLVDMQSKILDAIWPLLKSGGQLLYATCSVFKAENEDQIKAFISRHSDVKEQKITAAWGHEQDYGRQILPGDDDMDGFYYAVMVKL